MPTFQDLPPEILPRILRFANFVFEDERPTATRQQPQPQVFATLLNGSLVYRAWTVPCQKELWTSISFIGRGAPSSPASSSIRKFITNSLTLCGDFKTRELSVGCDMERLLLLLQFCKELRILQLGGDRSTPGPGNKFDMEVLQHPLAGLTDLTLTAAAEFAPPVATTTNLVFPFQLGRLTVTFDKTPLPLPIFASLLNPSLVYASFDFGKPISGDALAYLCAIEAHSMHILEVNLVNMTPVQNWLTNWFGPGSESNVLTRIKSFWSSFTTVKTLTINFDDMIYLESISTTLEVLNVVSFIYFYHGDMEFDFNNDEANDSVRLVIEKIAAKALLLEKTIPQFTNLKRLEINLDLNLPQLWIGFTELPTICERLGIEFVWTGGWKEPNLVPQREWKWRVEVPV